MVRETIWAIGYPRSGTHYLTWLLADALNCPSAGPDDGAEKFWSVGGSGRPAPYIVRHCHRKPGDGKKVLIVRDARDVLVSQMQYWGHTFEKRFDIVCKQQGALQDWSTYNEKWLDIADAVVRYEDLSRDCAYALNLTLQIADIPFDIKRVVDACRRQSFEARRGTVKTEGRDIPERFFWRGKVGNWREALTPEQAQAVVDKFNGTMRKMGYL